MGCAIPLQLYIIRAKDFLKIQTFSKRLFIPKLFIKCSYSTEIEHKSLLSF